MSGSEGFVEAVLAAPLGVAWLARLETLAVHDEGHALVTETTPAGVAAAVGLVERMSFAELVTTAVWSAVVDVGPWIPDAAAAAAMAYRAAPERRPVAEAIDGRFGAALHAPVDLATQQWWVSSGSWVGEMAPLFRDFEQVYGAGQFTWAGLWTVTDPPPPVHAQLVDAWEMYDGPLTRWHLPAEPDARVCEIHRPEDWARLVLAHPRPAASRDAHWELPGNDQDTGAVLALEAVPGQRAARTAVRTHLVPDWRTVARGHDAVHLSWAGLITSEGCITDLGGGDVSMLRYWFSERTLWLADVFGEPEPAPVPHLPQGRLPDGSRATLGAGAGPERRRRDRSLLDALLGRTPPQ